MKQQIVLARTVRLSENPAVQDSSVTNKTAVEILCILFIPTFISVER
jgi:hypothetical protein